MNKNNSKAIPTNINAILASVDGMKHVLHLYASTVNKYAIQAPFLVGARKGEEVFYVTCENPESVQNEFKRLNIKPSIIKPEDMGRLKVIDNKLRIIIDAGSIDPETISMRMRKHKSIGLKTLLKTYMDHLQRERYLTDLSENHSMLCTYDISSLNPEMIKQLVACHDKLILTTDDVTLLSSESVEDSDIANESIERFVKKYLDMIVLALIINKPMCGTDIIETIHRNFNVLLSPGTIYPLLHELKRSGLLEYEYEIKKKIYKPTKGSEPEIRNMLNEHFRASRFLNRFLKSGVKANVR